MKVFAVDWDGTLTRFNSLVLLEQIRRSDIVKKQALSSYLYYIGYLLCLPILILLHALKKDALRDKLTYFFYRGMTEQEISEFSEQFWKKNKLNALNQAVMDYLLKNKGPMDLAFIVSGSLRSIVLAGTTVLNLNNLIDGSICANLIFDKGQKGQTHGKLLGPPNVGNEKISRLKDHLTQNHLNPSELIAIADSYADLPLLFFADQAVLVSNSPKLIKVAKENNWTIITKS